MACTDTIAPLAGTLSATDCYIDTFCIVEQICLIQCWQGDVHFLLPALARFTIFDKNHHGCNSNL